MVVEVHRHLGTIEEEHEDEAVIQLSPARDWGLATGSTENGNFLGKIPNDSSMPYPRSAGHGRCPLFCITFNQLLSYFRINQICTQTQTKKTPSMFLVLKYTFSCKFPIFL